MARRDEDDDDDRPRRRRPRYDEEEDQDERPRARRKSSRDQDEEDYEDPPRRRRRRKAKETNVVGTIALVIAVGALVVALFMPCLASFSLIPAGIGIIVGFIALVLAQKSDGRQGTGLPITALSISAAAILIAVGWLFIGKKVEKKFEEIGAQAEAEAAKEEAKRKKERAKAATEVQTAGASGALRVSAVQFARAYEQDEDRADAMYRNKVIEVTGTVKELDLVNSDEAYIVELIGGPDEFDTVDCEFAKNPATRAELIKLKPGDTVIIRGKCLGGSPTLEACVLVH